MDEHALRERKIRQTLRSAQITSLIFGISLLIWALAPAIVQRLVSGNPPPLQTYAMGGLAMFFGLTFVALGVLIGRSVAWSLWAALVISATLFLLTLLTALTRQASILSLYPMLLAACTAGTCWLALDAQRSARRQKQPSGAS